MLTGDRNTPRIAGDVFEHPVAADTTIFAGALVCLTAAGWAVPGEAEPAYVAVGRAEELVVNAGANGAARVRVHVGVFRWANSASADEITGADIGAPAFVVDDETVARTDDDGGRPIAGFVVGLDELGVWVRTDPAMARAITALRADIAAIAT